MWTALRRLPIGSRLLAISLVSSVVSSIAHIAATCILSVLHLPDSSPEMLTVNLRSERIVLEGSIADSVHVASPEPVAISIPPKPDEPRAAEVFVRQTLAEHLPRRLQKTITTEAAVPLPNEITRKSLEIGTMPRHEPAHAKVKRNQTSHLVQNTRASVDRVLVPAREPTTVANSLNVVKQPTERQPTRLEAHRELDVAVQRFADLMTPGSDARDHRRKQVRAATKVSATANVERQQLAPQPIVSSKARVPQEAIALRSAAAPTMPRLVGQTPPSYPDSLRRQGIEGKVLLHIEVDETGGVVSVSVKESSGYAAFDESAIATVRRWRFEPAKRGRKPVSVRVTLPVVFRIVR